MPTNYADLFPTKITEAEWKEIPKQLKRRTPLTNLRQYFQSNKSNPKGFWITEDINFIILDKEGLGHGDKTKY